MKIRHLLLTLALTTLTLVATGASAQFSVLYDFGSNSGDPSKPNYSGMIAQGRDGNLYSTGPDGGGSCCGAVFQITPAGKLKAIHSFSGSGNDGAFPQGGVTLGTDGNFYGTTYEGGSATAGVVFRVTPGGTATTLHSFSGGKDGAYPYSAPVEGNDGNFYGTTVNGGDTTKCNSGCGTIYKITPAGALTTLHQFDVSHGDLPYAPLVLGTDGNFYGMTTSGTSANAGVVFRITPAGTFTVLFSFDSTHGESPFSGLVQGNDGNFYGTTIYGGATGAGVVFKITPSGKLTVLHNLNGTTEGAHPYGGLVQGTDGNFYGANAYGGIVNTSCSNGCGTLFKITPTGSYSVLYKFDSKTGAQASVTPFQHTAGVIYGDTPIGGTGNVNPCFAGNCGVFYKWQNSSLTPFVSLMPYSARVGKVVEFLGQGFVAAKTTVSFNGTAVTPTVVSSTYLTAAVPNGATTGLVTVTTSGVTLTSNKKFRVNPQLLSFKPSSGKVGTVVTITGVSLKQTTNVKFGGVATTSFKVNSDTQVTATVPTGAKTGNIVIATAGGSAASSAIFTVSP
ncbi:MAG TPA: choice-of-anchor tandem repeat GloVer-containing protein [Candidatus Sulfotelmatobacter sp.]|nr:choice-of-anchor tandem repeat GloVer-containing protein [Candidatus Sulfotelmatobacter sp.]